MTHAGMSKYGVSKDGSDEYLCKPGNLSTSNTAFGCLVSLLAQHRV